MKDILEEFAELFEEYDMNDRLVKQNHKFVERLNKRGNHKIKKPIDYGMRAS